MGRGRESVCLCVCERERKRQSDREKEKKENKKKLLSASYFLLLTFSRNYTKKLMLQMNFCTKC